MVSFVDKKYYSFEEAAEVDKLVEGPGSSPAAIIGQFLLLYKRNLLTTKRNYVIFNYILLYHYILLLIFL